MKFSLASLVFAVIATLTSVGYACDYGEYDYTDDSSVIATRPIVVSNVIQPINLNNGVRYVYSLNCGCYYTIINGQQVLCSTCTVTVYDNGASAENAIVSSSTTTEYGAFEY